MCDCAETDSEADAVAHDPRSQAVENALDSRWDGAVIDIQNWHFHRQLLQRYNIVLAPGEYSMIVAAIRRGTALLIERRGAKKAIYSVRIMSVRERIYVLASRENLITAWPPAKRLNAIRRALSDRTDPQACTGDDAQRPVLEPGSPTEEEQV